MGLCGNLAATSIDQWSVAGKELVVTFMDFDSWLGISPIVHDHQKKPPTCRVTVIKSCIPSTQLIKRRRVSPSANL